MDAPTSAKCDVGCASAAAATVAASAVSAETSTRASPATWSIRPRSAIAPWTLTSSGPTTPMRRPARAGGFAALTRTVVVCRAPAHPDAVTAQSRASAMRAALIRISSHAKIDGAGRSGPPRRGTTLRCRLLDDRGNALDLAGLQQPELRCDGRLDRRGRLRAPLAVADAVHLRVEDDVLPALQLAGLRRADCGEDRDVD